MVKVLSSKELLLNGTERIRWHLLDDQYQLVKPVEQFLRFRQAGGVRLGTTETYVRRLKFFWDYLSIKELDWRDITSDHVAEFGYWYLTGGLLLNNETNSTEPDINPFAEPKDIISTRRATTANLTITAVRIFYDYHRYAGNVDDKNLYQYKIPSGSQRSSFLLGHIKQLSVRVNRVRYKEQKRFPGCLTPEQLRTLINACSTSRDKLILWLLIELGLRIGELLGAHNCDFDWNVQTLKIVYRDNNPNQAYVKGQERELSIKGLFSDVEFCDILTKYLDEEYPHNKVKEIGHNMFFVVLHLGSPSYGQPLAPQNINKLLKRLHKKTNIDVERLYPHLFRHNFASHNIREGRKKGKGKYEVAKIVQKQLGHKSIATTLDVYDHSFDKAELAQEMSRILKSDDADTPEN